MAAIVSLCSEILGQIRQKLEEIVVIILTICAKIVSKVIRVIVLFNLINTFKRAFHDD